MTLYPNSYRHELLFEVVLKGNKEALSFILSRFYTYTFSMFKNDLPNRKRENTPSFNINQPDKFGKHILYFAIRSKNGRDCLMDLLAHDEISPDTHLHQIHRYGIGHAAVSSLDFQLLGTWLALHPNINLQDKNGWTPLHIALSHQQYLPMATLLLNAGADVSSSDSFGITPLHQGIHSNSLSYNTAMHSYVPLPVLEKILTHPNLPYALNAKTKNNKTPLDFSVQLGTLHFKLFIYPEGAWEKSLLLLSLSGKPCWFDKEGNITFLHLICSKRGAIPKKFYSTCRKCQRL